MIHPDDLKVPAITRKKTLLQTILLVAFFGYHVDTCMGQTDGVIDSLTNVLKNAEVDTLKINVHLRLSRRYLTLGKYKESMDHAGEALTLSREAHFEEGVARAYQVFGNVQRIQIKYDESLQSYKHALNIYKAARNSIGICKVHQSIGEVYLDQKHYEDAIKEYQIGLTFLEKDSSEVIIASVNNSIGLAYFYLDDYDRAFAHIMKAKDVAQKIKDLTIVAPAYLTLGHIAGARNTHDEALLNYQAALEAYLQTDNKRSVGICYYNIAGNYQGRKQYQEASDNFQKAKRIAEDLDDTSFLTGVLGSMANLEFSFKNYEKGIQMHLEVIDVAREAGNKEVVRSSHHNIAVAYKVLRQFEEAIKNQQIALKLSEELGNKYSMSLALDQLSEIYWYMDNNVEALKYAQASLEISKELNNVRFIGFTLYRIGVLQKMGGMNEAATQSMLEAIEVFKKNGPQEYELECYSFVSRIHLDQGRHTEALRYEKKRFELSNAIGNKVYISRSLRNIGNIYKAQKLNDRALENFQAALAIANDAEDKEGIGLCHESIGLLYIAQQDSTHLEKSLFHLEEAYKESRETGGLYSKPICNCNIGEVRRLQNRFADALKYTLYCLQLCEKEGSEELGANAMLNLGLIYTELGQYTEAHNWLDSCLITFQESGLKGQLTSTYFALARIDSIAGYHEQSLKHYKLGVVYRDSVHTTEKENNFAELQVQFETERKDKEIAFLENEREISDLELRLRDESLRRLNTENLYHLQKLDLLANARELQDCELEQNQNHLLVEQAESARKQDQLNLLNKEGEIQKMTIRKQTVMRNYLLAVLGLVVFSAFLLYRNYTTRQQLKLQSLRNKIASDLHDDVGSTLSSIYIFSEMARQQSKEVLPMLDTIGESSKKMLDAMADIVWTINPENDDFEKIIDRMRSFAYELLRAKGIEFQFEASEELHQLKLPMDVRKNLYLIFKEATNNMVKYANADKAFYSVKEENKNLTMTITDNGKGFNVSETSLGNGLKNMRKRAEEIGGKLFIDSLVGSGTTILLKVAV